MKIQEHYIINLIVLLQIKIKSMINRTYGADIMSENIKEIAC